MGSGGERPDYPLEGFTLTSAMQARALNRDLWGLV